MVNMVHWDLKYVWYVYYASTNTGAESGWKEGEWSKEGKKRETGTVLFVSHKTGAGDRGNGVYLILNSISINYCWSSLKESISAQLSSIFIRTEKWQGKTRCETNQMLPDVFNIVAKQAKKKTIHIHCQKTAVS